MNSIQKRAFFRKNIPIVGVRVGLNTTLVSFCVLILEYTLQKL